MEFKELVKKRESVRMFNGEKVSDEVINNILEYGRLAPTAKNNQPEKIIVVKSEEGIKLIDECTPCRYNAGVVLIVCADKSIAWSKEDYSSYEMDASIVATHVLLGCTNEGVDSIWVKMFNEEKIKELFKLDDSIIPVCLIPIGYRKNEYKGSINHLNRKPLSDLVIYK